MASAEAASRWWKGIGFGSVLRFLRRHLDLWIALILLVALSNTASLLSSPVYVGRIDSILDRSWAYDLVVKARRSEWLGEKVIFTYGPAFQLGFSAVPNLLGGSLGAYFRSWYVFPFWSGVILTFLSGRILLAAHPSWKRGFYLLLLVGFWGALDPRFCFIIVVFALSLHYFERARHAPRILWPLTGLLAALLMLGTLISADTGLYSLAALMIPGAVYALFCYKDHYALRALLRHALALLICTSVLALAITAWTGISFWIDSADVVSRYRWLMAYSMDKAVKWRMVSAWLVSLLVLLIGWKYSDPQASSLCRRPPFYPAAITFSLLTLQSGFVRADWFHVQLALLPSIALAGAVLMGSERHRYAGWRGVLPMGLAMGLTAFFTGPHPSIVPKNFVANLRLSIPQNQSCPPGTFYLDGACLGKDNYEHLQPVIEYLRQNTRPGESVAIFPYENIYADLARRSVAGGLLQNYIAVSGRLANRQIAGLERDDPRIAIFSADGLGTFALDGVPNATRAPEVWLYLQSRFKQVSELAPGVIALERDRTRTSRWRMETVPLLGPTHSRVLHKQPINLAWSNWPTVADFLKITLKVDYPLWWKVRKPSALTITIGHSDGSQKILRAVVPPNESSVLWIYPWDDIHLRHYFAAEESAWRGGRSPAAPSSLQLTFQRMDDLSVVPSSVAVESVEAVLLRLR